jgi:hypothetical protein
VTVGARPSEQRWDQSDELDDELDEELVELDEELDELGELVDGVGVDALPAPVDEDAGVEEPESERLSVR